MYCPNCGQKVEANARFCGACGHAISSDAAPPATAAAAPAKKKMATWKKVALGVVPVEYRLVKENDAWRIMGINLGGQ